MNDGPAMPLVDYLGRPLATMGVPALMIEGDGGLVADVDSAAAHGRFVLERHANGTGDVVVEPRALATLVLAAERLRELEGPNE